MMTADDTSEIGVIDGDASLLIVDDDKPFLTRLARAMEGRGFAVDTAESVEEAVGKARAHPPAYAVVDMRLGDGNGLDVVAAIREGRDGRPHRHPDRLRQHRHRSHRRETRRDRLSVEAGRCRRHLCRADPHLRASAPRRRKIPMSADRVRWEHIQRVYEMCDRNVSETARRLNMHRRTLQRILAKRAPR